MSHTRHHKKRCNITVWHNTHTSTHIQGRFLNQRGRRRGDGGGRISQHGHQWWVLGGLYRFLQSLSVLLPHFHNSFQTENRKAHVQNWTCRLRLKRKKCMSCVCFFIAIQKQLIENGSITAKLHVEPPEETVHLAGSISVAIYPLTVRLETSGGHHSFPISLVSFCCSLCSSCPP